MARLDVAASSNAATIAQSSLDPRPIGKPLSWCERLRLFRLEAGELRHGLPFRNFARDERGEVLGRARRGLGRERLEPVLQLRRFQPRIDRHIEPRDDIPGGGGRHHDPGPGAGDEIGHAAFDHGRHVRKLGNPRRGRDAERPQARVVDMAEHDRGGLEAEVDLAADQVGDHVRCALVGHDHHVGFGEGAKPGGDQVRRSSVGHADIELARVRFGIGDHLGDALGRDARAGDHHIRHAGDEADRREARRRVVPDTAVERGPDRKRRRACKQQRVAIGIGRSGGARGKRAAGAWAVLDHDLLAERR